MGTLTQAEFRTELWLLMKSADEFDPSVAGGQARCDRFLNISYKRIQLPSVFDHIEKQDIQVVPLVAGTGTYTVTLHNLSHIQYVQSSIFNRRVRPMTRPQMSALVRTSGPPTRYARWGGLIYLDYIPSAAEAGQTLNLFGWTEPTAIVA